MSKEKARGELRRVGLNPSDRKLRLLTASLDDDEVILEGIEGAAACPAYNGSAVVILTNRRVLVVCEPNWLSGLTTAPEIEQLPWRDIGQVDAEPNGLLRLYRSGSTDPLSIRFSVGSKSAESFHQFGARIRNTAEAARTAEREPERPLQMSELERLVELHRNGSLTAEEFRAAKAKLLGL
jgi:hypothetical protein